MTCPWSCTAIIFSTISNIALLCFGRWNAVWYGRMATSPPLQKKCSLTFTAWMTEELQINLLQLSKRTFQRDSWLTLSALCQKINSQRFDHSTLYSPHHSRLRCMPTLWSCHGHLEWLLSWQDIHTRAIRGGKALVVFIDVYTNIKVLRLKCLGVHTEVAFQELMKQLFVLSVPSFLPRGSLHIVYKYIYIYI